MLDRPPVFRFLFPPVSNSPRASNTPRLPFPPLGQRSSIISSSSLFSFQFEEHSWSDLRLRVVSTLHSSWKMSKRRRSRSRVPSLLGNRTSYCEYCWWLWSKNNSIEWVGDTNHSTVKFNFVTTRKLLLHALHWTSFSFQWAQQPWHRTTPGGLGQRDAVGQGNWLLLGPPAEPQVF